MPKRQLTQIEWIYWIQKYENHEFEWHDFFISTGWKLLMTNFQISEAKKRFKLKLRKYQKLGHNVFMSNKKKPTGRPKSDNERKKQFEDAINELTKDELKEIAHRYYEITKDNKKSAAIEEFSKVKLSAQKLSYVFGISRQSISKYRKGYQVPKSRNSKYVIHLPSIEKIFVENRGVYGRLKISKVLAKRGIEISPRTIENLMNKADIHSGIRKKKRIREQKNTISNYLDMVMQNFNPQADNIVATDVKYIPCHDSFSLHNHIYLSAAISHKTKLVESWSLGKLNDDELVYNTLKNISSRNDLVVHSDHRAQYTSELMVGLAIKNKYRISLKGTDDPRDNREIEYFFSILEVELLQQNKTLKMSFDEIKQMLNDYISWYNNKRIQKRTNWKAPIEVSAYKCVNS